MAGRASLGGHITSVVLFSAIEVFPSYGSRRSIIT